MIRDNFASLSFYLGGPRRVPIFHRAPQCNTRSIIIFLSSLLFVSKAVLHKAATFGNYLFCFTRRLAFIFLFLYAATLFFFLISLSNPIFAPSFRLSFAYFSSHIVEYFSLSLPQKISRTSYANFQNFPHDIL